MSRASRYSQKGHGTSLVALATLLGLVVLANTGFATTIPITFNPTGSGNAADNVVIQSLDEKPGNALALGYNQGPEVGPWTLPVKDDTFTLIYQAGVTTLMDPSNTFSQYTYGKHGSGANVFYDQLTVVASVTEKLTTNATSGTSSFEATGVGNAYIYYYSTTDPTTLATDLTGQNFQLGQQIYHGILPSGTGSFTVTDPATPPLDGHTPDNYLGILSVTGKGATTLTFNTQSYSSAFFQLNNVPAQFVISISDTSNQTPFNATNPAAQMWTGDPGATSVGGVNGGVDANGNPVGRNVIFQADAATGFNVVPEPSALITAFYGGSLAGVIGFARHLRRRRTSIEG